MHRVTNDKQRGLGFTIVELLIVVVVIGILATITVVSFNGIVSQTKIASIKYDLDTNSRKLQLYYTQYSSYPTSLDGNKCPSLPTPDTNYCLKFSNGATFSSYTGTTSNYTLEVVIDGSAYQVTPDSGPVLAQQSLEYYLNYNATKLQQYYTQYGSYPSALDGSNCPSAPTANTNYCLQFSYGTTFNYYGISTIYTLKATKDSVTYRMTQAYGPKLVTLAPCPSGFIEVPGSSTYSTNDFCVMKYEAKCASTGALSTGLTSPSAGPNTYDNATTACTSSNSRAVVSTASGYPIANISQNTASSYATSTAGCTGCHLITEAERMTVAQNVSSNPANWSGGSIGSGYIYSGHNDGSPAYTLPASDDSNGYYGTGNSSGNQKRTLTLTNGENIWDTSGNAWEWTSGQMTGGQPGGGSWAAREWNSVSGGSFSVSPYPSGTGITGSGSWTSSNGVGVVYSNSADGTLRGLIRGARWDDSWAAGIYTMNISAAPTYYDTTLGFRVAR